MNAAETHWAFTSHPAPLVFSILGIAGFCSVESHAADAITVKHVGLSVAGCPVD